MTSLNPYLTFNGNCREAFEFYQTVFGVDVQFMGTFKDMPDSPDYTIPESEKDLIMHVSIEIGDGSTLMGSDTSEAFGHVATQGSNFSISIHADTKEEVNRLFSGLSESGQITMPLADTFWGSYFGMLTDQFGIQWMVSCDLKTK